MRRSGRHGRRARVCQSVFLGLTTAGVLAAVLFVPADSGAWGTADRLSGTADARALPSAASSGDSQPITGVPAVGALFEESSGQLTGHFCTASVVNSPAGDIAVTAAHCFEQISTAQVVFVPGYDNGARPYGVWRVTHVYTDAAWQSSQDTDDDVAFIQLANASDDVPVEDVTGAEQVAASAPGRAYVQVVGYPDVASRPVWCANWADDYSPTQLRFDCGGYTYGTSGSPFLTSVSPATGEGTVIGVIGGYEQGGLTADVSYAVAFGRSVTSLYRTAEAGGQ